MLFRSAMMDSSDGLADSLFKIAQASDKTLVLDFNKVVYDKELEELYPDEYKEMILYGGEDYQLISTVSKNIADKFGLHIIGRVEDKQDNIPVKILNYDNTEKIITNLDKCFNHFG